MGNVVGSALAVSVGGPGVIFWMMIAGVFSMALKFAEVLLGIKFRQINKDGTSSGGPMYYIIKGYRDSLIDKEWFVQDIYMTIYFWGVVAVVFAIGTIIFKRLKVHFADVL